MARSSQSGIRLTWCGYLIGFGLSGFFDGILLHQILQWHHLLSLVDGVGSLREQVLFDGLFHALMYVVAATGLALLFAGRAQLNAPGSTRQLGGSLLIGFGAWHVIDALLSHWLLGIHRIKLDSSAPLAWDLGWLAVFGIVPLIAGLLLRRGRDGGGSERGARSAALGLAAAVLAAGAWAAQPPPGAKTALVVFAPGIGDGAAFNAIMATGGSPLWRSRSVWAVRWPDRASAAGLYRAGALLVSASPLAGCLAWSQA